MINSVVINLRGIGEHKVERAQMCDGFGFETTTEGFAKLEERILRSVFYIQKTRGVWWYY